MLKTILIWRLPSILCVIGAIVSSIYNVSGWGWFLVVAAIFYPSKEFWT